MSDLVERLRARAEQEFEMLGDIHLPLMEAAARIKRLEAALRPFADESIFSGAQHEYVTVKRSDCDIALAALEDRT